MVCMAVLAQASWVSWPGDLEQGGLISEPRAQHATSRVGSTPAFCVTTDHQTAAACSVLAAGESSMPDMPIIRIYAGRFGGPGERLVEWIGAKRLKLPLG